MPITSERLPVDTEEALRLSRNFQRLRVADIEGKPRIGDLPNTGWVDHFLRAAWGGPDIREALLTTPKKNAKTSFGALGFFAAFMTNRQPQQSFSIIAPTIKIAKYSFDMIAGAIREDETLQRFTHSREYIREITNLRTHSTLQIVPFTKGMTGLKGNVLVDEVAVLGGMHAGTGLRAQLKGALVANKHAKALYITTTDEEPPAGIWAALINYARLIRDAKLADPTFLPMIYEPPKGVDVWNDPSWWAKIHPSYPHTVDETFLRSVVNEANASGPSAVKRDKAQFFNVEATTYGSGEDTWRVADLYDAISEEFDLDDLVEWADDLSIGIDLGGLDDLAALCVLGSNGDDWRIWVKTWAMRSAWDRNIASRSAFDDFESDGDLEFVEVDEDVAAMVEICEEMAQSGKLKGVGIDPAGAKQLVDALAEKDDWFVLQEDEEDYPPDMIPIVGVSQTALRLQPALLTSERKAAGGHMEIAESRLMGWSLGNVVIVKRGAAKGIDREVPTAKIDAVAAMLDAVSVELAIESSGGFDVGALVA